MPEETPTAGDLDPCSLSCSPVQVARLASRLFLKPVFSRSFPQGLTKSLGSQSNGRRAATSPGSLGGREEPHLGPPSCPLVSGYSLGARHLAPSPEAWET